VFSGKTNFITQKAKPNIKTDLVEAILQGLFFYPRNIEKSLANTALSVNKMGVLFTLFAPVLLITIFASQLIKTFAQ